MPNQHILELIDVREDAYLFTSEYKLLIKIDTDEYLSSRYLLICQL